MAEAPCNKEAAWAGLVDPSVSLQKSPCDYVQISGSDNKSAAGYLAVFAVLRAFENSK